MSFKHQNYSLHPREREKKRQKSILKQTAQSTRLAIKAGVEYAKTAIKCVSVHALLHDIGASVALGKRLLIDNGVWK